jgi:hypothetical protein
LQRQFLLSEDHDMPVFLPGGNHSAAIVEGRALWVRLRREVDSVVGRRKGRQV